MRTNFHAVQVAIDADMHQERITVELWKAGDGANELDRSTKFIEIADRVDGYPIAKTLQTCSSGVCPPALFDSSGLFSPPTANTVGLALLGQSLALCPSEGSLWAMGPPLALLNLISLLIDRVALRAPRNGCQNRP